VAAPETRSSGFTAWTRDHVRAAAGLLRKHRGQFLLFHLLVVGVELALVAPAIQAALAWLIATSGHLALSNEQILTFLLSARGIVGAGVIGVVLYTTFWWRRAGAMWIAASRTEEGRISALSALGSIVFRRPRLLLLNFYRLVLALLAISPIAAGAGAVAWTLLGKYDLYFLVSVRPPAFWWGATLIGILVLVGLFVLASLFARWALAVPVLLFEKTGAWEALRIGREMVRGHQRRVFGLCVGWWAIVTLAGAGALLAAGALGGVLFASETLPLTVAVAGVIGLVILGVLLATAITFALDSGIGVILLGLYVELGGEGKPPPVRARDRRGRGFRAGGWAVAAGLLLLVLGELRLVSELAQTGPSPLVTAHRGSSRRAPENSLSAIRKAIEDGADYAEIDVQETADGHVVLIHDTDLRRVAGDRRPIWEARLSDLRGLDAGSWFSPEFAGERIPTLEEAIDVAGDEIRLNIELKINSHEERLPERVVEILRAKGFRDRCLITSLDFRALERVRRLDPELPLGFIVFETVGDLSRLPVEALSVETRLANVRLIRRAESRGVQIHVWTINDRPGMLRMILRGAHNIITDEPALCRKVVEEYEQLDEAQRLFLALRQWWSE
jgi:glycerophosphoryl diester phosphodiesterase